MFGQSFKIVVGIALLFLINKDALSQTDAVGSFNRHVFEAWKGEYVRIGPYKVKGSPYLLGEAFPATINYKDGKVSTNVKVLYDIYEQKAGMELDNKIFEANVPIETFSISLPEKFGGEKLLFKNSYIFGKSEMKCYFNVLEDGSKLTLLKVFRTKLVPDPTNNMDKDLKVFSQGYDYYIFERANNTLTSVKLRKKDITSKIANDTFLKSYLSNNEIDFNKEQDVVKLVKNFNNL